jgi:hypothetical protein
MEESSRFLAGLSFLLFVENTLVQLLRVFLFLLLVRVVLKRGRFEMSHAFFLCSKPWHFEQSQITFNGKE